MPNLKKIAGFKKGKAGFNHWRAQKLATVALIITGTWILALLLQDRPFSYAAARLWFQSPWHYLLSLGFSLSLLIDFYLGIVTIVHDYIHEDKVHNLIITLLKGSIIVLAVGYILTLTILQAL